jgi:hypothetical protein
VLLGGLALVFNGNYAPQATTRPTSAVASAGPRTANPLPGTVARSPTSKKTELSAPAEAEPVDPVHRGWDLFIAGDFAGAKASFEPLTTGQRPNSQALHGLALCIYKLDRDPRPALAAIDQAVLLAPRDESIVYNAAVLHLVDSPARSARLLHDYMADSERPLNEAMQNLLGLALSRADAKTQATPEWRDAQAFYADYDTRLEAGRTQRRWGEQWLDPADAQARWLKLRAATIAVDNAARIQRDASAEATRQSFQALDAVAESPNSREADEATARFQKARQAEAAAKEKLKQAQADLEETEKPPFTLHVEPVVPKAMQRD